VPSLENWSHFKLRLEPFAWTGCPTTRKRLRQNGNWPLAPHRQAPSCHNQRKRKTVICFSNSGGDPPRSGPENTKSVPSVRSGMPSSTRVNVVFLHRQNETLQKAPIAGTEADPTQGPAAKEPGACAPQLFARSAGTLFRGFMMPTLSASFADTSASNSVPLWPPFKKQFQSAPKVP